MRPPLEVIQATQDHLRNLRSQLREAEQLSEPCPPGRWRWADANLSGYGRKTDAELAADRERYRGRAADLRSRIAVVEAWLADIPAENVQGGRQRASLHPRRGGDTAP